MFELVVYGQLSRIRPGLRVPVDRDHNDDASATQDLIESFQTAVGRVKESTRALEVCFDNVSKMGIGLCLRHVRGPT